MIKTRKHIILSALSFIITACLAGSSLPISCQDDAPQTKQQFDVNLPVVENNKKHDKRMRKREKKEKKTKRGRTYMDMEYEELVIAKDAQKARNNISAAIKYLE